MLSSTEMPVKPAQVAAPTSARVGCNDVEGSAPGRPFQDRAAEPSVGQFNSKAVTHSCPCCGMPLKNQRPQIDLNTNTFVFRDLSVRMSARKAELLSILVNAYPRTVSHDVITAGMFGVTEPEDARNTIKVWVFQLRQLLAGFDCWISTEPNVGYRFVQ